MSENVSWIEKNRELKNHLNLPDYEPPRFEDDVFTHQVVDKIENKHNCTIRFIGKNTEYLDDWQVRVDGTPVFTVGRHRDENGNTVFEIASDSFRRKVNNTLLAEGT